MAKKVTWIKISSRRYGGAIYGQRAQEALVSRGFEVEQKKIQAGNSVIKYLKPLSWFYALLGLRGQSDLWIRDDLFSLATMRFDKTIGRELAVIYHIDFSVFPFLLRPLFHLLEKLACWNMKKADAILTISNYWQNYFQGRGYNNVYKIYPAFNLADLNIAEQEILDFKKKYQLEGKPIIYLGNCQKAKGVVEAYEALKSIDAHFVTSSEPQVKIGALNFNLNYREYLCLLRASALVITMSRFNEGWCMTAHEAMLLKTPVIGSGKGGMGELLEGGKQIICRDAADLKEKADYLLSSPQARVKMGEDGFNYAKNFTQEKFNQDWLNLVQSVIIK